MNLKKQKLITSPLYIEISKYILGGGGGGSLQKFIIMKDLKDKFKNYGIFLVFFF